jgi:hypothetical protein
MILVAIARQRVLRGSRNIVANNIANRAGLGFVVAAVRTDGGADAAVHQGVHRGPHGLRGDLDRIGGLQRVVCDRDRLGGLQRVVSGLQSDLRCLGGRLRLKERATPIAERRLVNRG